MNNLPLLTYNYATCDYIFTISNKPINVMVVIRPHRCIITESVKPQSNIIICNGILNLKNEYISEQQVLSTHPPKVKSPP